MLTTFSRLPPVVTGERRSFAPPPSTPPSDPPSAPIAQLWQQSVPSARVSGAGIALPVLDESTLRLPPMPLPMDAQAAPDAAAVVAAAAQLAHLAQEVAKIRADTTLTPEGKAKSLSGPADAALVAATVSMSTVLATEADIDRREAALCAAPPAPTDAAGVARAAEIRARLLAMPASDAMALVQRLIENDLADEVVSALLRAPLPMPAALEEHVTALWKASRLAKNPQAADSIVQARDSLDHSKRSLAAIGTMAAQIVNTYAGGDIAERVLAMRPKVTDREIWPLGITAQQLEAARRRRAARSVH